jgi:hypothetical protein
MVKMRRGVTLFITLAIISAMLGVIGIVFSYLESARAKAEFKASLIQGNLLFADTKTALRRLLGKTPKTSTYKLFYDTPLPVAALNGEFGILVHCAPLADRPNIAWLGQENDAKHEAHYAIADKLFEHLLQKTSLKNPTLLRDMLIDALKSRRLKRFNILSNINKKKGTITYREFQAILDDYRFEADDDRVYTIPWKNYFVFGTDLKRIDSSFIRPEVLATVFDIDLQLVQGSDGFAMGDDLKAFLEENGLDTEWYDLNGTREVFAKKHPVDAMRCTVNYGFREGQYAFAFDYINKRVENFEYLGR